MSAGYFIGSGISQAGTDTSLIGKLGNVWTNYLNTKLQAKSVELQGNMFGIQADEYDSQAKDYLEIAGSTQMQGRETAEIRGMQLGQDIGRIYSGASGSGIDVSSATVRHVENGMRKEAYRDMSTIVSNASSQANSAISNATAARKSAIWSRADQQNAYLNSSMLKKSANWQLVGGLLSTAGWHMSQTSQNWSM